MTNALATTPLIKNSEHCLTTGSTITMRTVFSVVKASFAKAAYWAQLSHQIESGVSDVVSSSIFIAIK